MRKAEHDVVRFEGLQSVQPLRWDHDLVRYAVIVVPRDHDLVRYAVVVAPRDHDLVSFLVATFIWSPQL